MSTVLVGACDNGSEAFLDVGYIAIKDTAKVAGDQQMFFSYCLDFALVRIMLDPGFKQNYRQGRNGDQG